MITEEKLEAMANSYATVCLGVGRNDDMFYGFIAGYNNCKSQHEWVACLERLPTEGQTVLVWGLKEAELSSNHYGPSIGLVTWNNEEFSDCADTCYYGIWYTKITHWMPLPEPPKTEI
jgi:hypothetical protein